MITPSRRLCMLGFLLGCGGGAGGGDGDGGAPGPDATDEPTVCAPRAPAPVDLAFRKLHGMAVDGAGPGFLVDTDAGLEIARVDGSHQLLDAAGADAAAIAVRADDTLCAAWYDEETTRTRYACAPGWVPVETGLDVDMGTTLAMAEGERICGLAGDCQAADHAGLFFTGGLGGADAAARTAGQWAEEELFESSLSYFGGAASVGGEVFACMITSTGNLGIVGIVSDFGPSFDRIVLAPTTEAPIQRCAMAAHGPDLAVVFWNDFEVRVGRLPPATGPGPVPQERWSSMPVDVPAGGEDYAVAALDGQLQILWLDDTGTGVHRARQAGAGWISAAVAGLEDEPVIGRVQAQVREDTLHLAVRGNRNPPVLLYARECAP